MHRYICVIGGGGALAQPLLEKYRLRDWYVTAVCRSKEPTIRWNGLKVVRNVGQVGGGQLHHVVVMPGAVANAKIERMTDDDWCEVIDANLSSVFRALKVLAPKVNENGSIVVVGSIVGRIGGYGCANYAAAKAGLVGLVKTAALEFPKIRINLLELGYVDCGMGANLPAEIKEKIKQTIPMRRFATVEEFVSAIEFMLDMYSTGGIVTLAGGL